MFMGLSLLERLDYFSDGAIVAQARTAGYTEMRLDTLPTMQTALAMYARAGFREIPAYYPTPIAGTIFLGLAL